jgi:hypothetical protein
MITGGNRDNGVLLSVPSAPSCSISMFVLVAALLLWEIHGKILAVSTS